MSATTQGVSSSPHDPSVNDDGAGAEEDDGDDDGDSVGDVSEVGAGEEVSEGGVSDGDGRTVEEGSGVGVGSSRENTEDEPDDSATEEDRSCEPVPAQEAESEASNTAKSQKITHPSRTARRATSLSIRIRVGAVVRARQDPVAGH